MATINFPANPQLNDTYTFLGRTWIYNGIGWVVKPDDITAFVNKGGDTMSGKLTITSGGLSVSGTTSLEAIKTSSQTLVDNLNADFLDGQEGAFYRNASNLNAGTLALLYGGTGSTTAAGARTNLGAAALAGSSTQDFSTQNLTVSGTTYNMLTLSRTTANGASILFQNSSGNLGKLGFDDSGNLIIGKGTTTDGAADLLKITPDGVTTFYNSVTASSFIKSGGTSSQFLKADGTVDSNAYLPLSGGILTGYLEINTPNTSGSSFLRFKRNGVNVGYVGDGASGANTEIELSNYISGKSLSLGNDGILRYGGNVVWHQGNDGTNSGLDADMLDGLHAKYNGGGTETWGYIPVVGVDGTMQVGRYLDFNHSSGIGADYNARLHTNGVTDGELYINSNRIWHAGNLNLSTYFTYRGSFTSSSNANNMTDMGMWLNTTGNGSGNSNFPAQYGYIQTFSRGVENYSRWQMSVDNTADNIHIRAEWAGVWGGWKKLWHSANDGSGSGLDADLLDGLHAADFFKVVLNSTTDVNDTTYWQNKGGKLFNAPNAPFNYYSFLSFGEGIYQGQLNAWNNSLKFRAGDENGIDSKQWLDVYTSGNSNKKTIDWNAKDLTLNGSITGLSTIVRTNANAVDEDVYGNLAWKAGTPNSNNWNVGTVFYVYKSGNVMIGSSLPDSGYKLDVNGTSRFSDTMLTKNIIFNSNNTWGNLGSVRCTWGNDGGYPTLYGSSAERWVMHINPHISYVQNGIGEYTGAMNGATIRFAGNYGATTAWDLGVGCNSVGSDKFSIGRSTTSFVSLDNAGNFGIGTTSPSYKLDVSGTFRVNHNYSTTFTGNDINFTRTDGSSYINAGNTLSLGAGGTSGVLNITSNNVATFKELLLTDGARIYSSAGAGLGISLFNEPSFNPNYGLMFAQTVYKGAHGAVNGDWATYFTMSTDAGRGWIFTSSAADSSGNVASISNTGDAMFNGKVKATWFVGSDNTVMTIQSNNLVYNNYNVWHTGNFDSKYTKDTGWLALSVGSSFTGSNLYVRQVGRLVMVEGYLTSNLDVQTGDILVATLPSTVDAPYVTTGGASFIGPDKNSYKQSAMWKITIGRHLYVYNVKGMTAHYINYCYFASN